MRPACAVIAVALLASCALRPATTDVQAFGVAADKAVTVLADNATLEQELASETAILSNGCSYLRGSRYQLAAARQTQPIEILAEQEQFLGALSDYAKALAQATDPESVAKLRSAAAGFSTAAGTLVATAAPGTPGSTLAGPLIHVVVNAVVDVSELSRRHQIRAIAASVHDQLVDGSGLILNDAEPIRDALLGRLTEWEEAARCNLHSIRHDAGAGLERFLALDRQKRGYLVRIAVLDRSVATMGALLLTHKQIVDGEGDLAAAVAEFDNRVAGLVALKNAVEKL